MPRAIRALAALGLLALTACSAGPGIGGGPRPAPSIQTAAGSVRCTGSDHGLDEVQFGWGFCYPGDWKYREKLQPSQAPKGVDTTFDIVVAPPTAQPDQGLFGYMIIGTYELDGSTGLDEWARRNLGPDVQLTPLQWGNARSAAVVEGPRRQRIALTAHHIVTMDIREGEGNLGLDAEMGKRLTTWRFDF